MYKGDSTTTKEVVQAVLVSDLFENEFKPITDSVLFQLMPLGNIPILEYTLEFLSLGGVEEVFMVCSAGGADIKKYIKKRVNENALWSRWMTVNIILSETCRSFGDCLRDLDAKGLIRGNFILVEPGTIGNINLVNYLQRHVKVCKVDKNAVATLILQNSGKNNSNGSLNNNITAVVNESKRILYYQSKKSCKIQIPVELFQENKVVDIFHDLKDVHVMMCSMSVLPLFSDNFDFQTRDDFVRGILMNEEIMGSTIYFDSINDNEFGSGIKDWRSYHSISLEVMHRWAYPMTPDVAGGGHYRYMKNNIYRSQDVQMGKNVSLLEDVVIGPKSIICNGSRISRSVIGSNVQIGKNVNINNSFIMSNVKLEDNVEVDHSVIGNNCHVHAKGKVLLGSILGAGVVIPAGKKLEDNLVQSQAPEGSNKSSKIGDKAYKITHDDNDITDHDKNEISKALSRLHLHNSDNETSSESDVSENSDELSYRNSPIQDDTNMFLTEVMDSLARGFEDKLQCDNLILEINSSRYAYNVSLREVNLNVSKAILELAFQNLPSQQSTGLQYWTTLQPLLKYFKPILKNYIRNDEAMQDALKAVEEVSDSNSEIAGCVVKILEWFYDNDLITEENIMRWNSDLNRKSKLYEKVQPFIIWLLEAEEDSESEEE